ncbi:MAG: YybH family protein [Gemmataceae bacterium]
MNRRVGLGIVLLMAMIGVGFWSASTAQEKTPPAGLEAATAGLKTLAASYTTAYQAGDARAVAAHWTATGEYTDAEGQTFIGPAAIEQEFVPLFRNPTKTTIRIQLDDIRLLGQQTARVEGTVEARRPDAPEPILNPFRGLFVQENGVWKIASLTDWSDDGVEEPEVPLTTLGWLVGDWVAFGDGGALKVRYSWDTNQRFLRGEYTLRREGRIVNEGMHILGRDPRGGGIRAWLFDGSGLVGEATWTRDGNRWLADSSGQSPNGAERSARAVIVPLGPDAFTWQTINQVIDGEAMPDEVPLKILRATTTK